MKSPRKLESGRIGSSTNGEVSPCGSTPRSTCSVSRPGDSVRREKEPLAAHGLNDLPVLGPVLDGLCHMVEGLLSDSFVSIRLLNPGDNRLWYVATGGLPSSYVEAFDGVSVGPAEGSCGTGSFRYAEVKHEPLDGVTVRWSSVNEVTGCWL